VRAKEADAIAMGEWMETLQSKRSAWEHGLL